MSDLPESLFLNPVWHSLHGPHRHLAHIEGGACRYPADVAPFAAIDAPSAAAFAQLRALLDPDESLWIADYGRSAPGLAVDGAAPPPSGNLFAVFDLTRQSGACAY